jgi:hypothetical protein
MKSIHFSSLFVGVSLLFALFLQQKQDYNLSVEQSSIMIVNWQNTDLENLLSIDIHETFPTSYRFDAANLRTLIDAKPNAEQISFHLGLDNKGRLNLSTIAGYTAEELTSTGFTKQVSIVYPNPAKENIKTNIAQELFFSNTNWVVKDDENWFAKKKALVSENVAEHLIKQGHAFNLITNWQEARESKNMEVIKDALMVNEEKINSLAFNTAAIQSLLTVPDVHFIRASLAIINDEGDERITLVLSGESKTGSTLFPAVDNDYNLLEFAKPCPPACSDKDKKKKPPRRS